MSGTVFGVRDEEGKDKDVVVSISKGTFDLAATRAEGEEPQMPDLFKGPTMATVTGGVPLSFNCAKE